MGNKEIEREFTTIKGYAQRKAAQSHMRKLYKPVSGKAVYKDISSQGNFTSRPIIQVAFEGMQDVDLSTRV